MSDIPVTHQREQSRFEAVVDGHRGTVEYAMAGPHVMQILHTEVSPALEGRGVAGALVSAALDHARREGYKVQPLCGYAAAYMQRNAETRDLLAKA